MVWYSLSDLEAGYNYMVVDHSTPSYNRFYSQQGMLWTPVQNALVSLESGGVDQGVHSF